MGGLPYFLVEKVFLRNTLISSDGLWHFACGSSCQDNVAMTSELVWKECVFCKRLQSLSKAAMTLDLPFKRCKNVKSGWWRWKQQRQQWDYLTTVKCFNKVLYSFLSQSCTTILSKLSNHHHIKCKWLPEHLSSRVPNNFSDLISHCSQHTLLAYKVKQGAWIIIWYTFRHFLEQIILTCQYLP